MFHDPVIQGCMKGMLVGERVPPVLNPQESGAQAPGVMARDVLVRQIKNQEGAQK
jgi:hypothetical protein